jgi:hypothetical protein
MSHDAGTNDITHVEGNAYVFRWPIVPSGLVVIKDNTRQPLNAPTLVLENGVSIGSMDRYANILDVGGGGISHSGGANLYFSTPDNTNPSENGRSYTVKYVVELTKVTSSVIAFFGFLLSVLMFTGLIQGAVQAKRGGK